MDTFIQDVRYGARRLWKSPSFTLVAVLTLALGIGANAAIFSVVNAVLLRSLPFPEPERLDRIFAVREGIGEVPSAAPDFLQQQAENRSYEALAAFDLFSPNLTGEGDPERLNGAEVSASFFDAMGVHPEVGRGFTAEENEPGRHRVAVLGHAFWQQRFGADPAVVGRTIQLDGAPFEVVGVMPAGFDFPRQRALWTPLEYDATFRDDASRGAHYLNVVGRRRPGVTLEEARADLAATARRIETDFPELKSGFTATARTLRETQVGELRAPLLILLGAVGLVLLIACANVANLLLTRATARESELAVRAALGAERRRLARQLLTESLLLGALGGAVGLLLTVWGTAWLAELRPEGIPRLDEVGVDWRVSAFTAGVSLLTGLLFGAIPAYQVTRGDLTGSLKEGGRGGAAGRGTSRTRAALVVAETALAVMLLAGAGLLIRSFAALNAVDPGFRSEGTLTFDLAVPAAAYPGDEEVRAFYARLDEGLRSVPGVTSVGMVAGLPMGGVVQRISFQVEGRPEPIPGQEEVLDVHVATPDYFSTMGIPLLRGRGLSEEDRAGGAGAVVITEAAARRHFADEDPIGRRIELGWTRGADTVGGWVVGVVGDVRSEGLTVESRPSLYVPHAQAPVRQASVVLRVAGPPMEVVPAVRREVQALDPNLPLFNARTMEQVLSDSVSRPRFYTLLLALFAGVALLLAAIGIFGVMSYSVVQRTREIGIRVALGADPRSVLRTVVGRAMGLTLSGVALGIAGALAGTRLLSGLLFGVAPTDPLTLAAVATVLTAVALVASYLPARRATRVDPTVALRSE